LDNLSVSPLRALKIRQAAIEPGDPDRPSDERLKKLCGIIVPGEGTIETSRLSNEVASMARELLDWRATVAAAQPEGMESWPKTDAEIEVFIEKHGPFPPADPKLLAEVMRRVRTAPKEPTSEPGCGGEGYIVAYPHTEGSELCPGCKDCQKNESPWFVQRENVRGEGPWYEVQTYTWATGEDKDKLKAIEGEPGGFGSNGKRRAERILKRLLASDEGANDA